MKKLLLLLIKYIPVIQMAGMLVYNTCYYYGVGLDWIFLIHFSIGTSIANAIILIMASYVLGFCDCHRLIIIGNIGNVMIDNADDLFNVSLSTMQSLCIHQLVVCGIIITIVINHICRKHDKRKVEYNKVIA